MAFDVSADAYFRFMGRFSEPLAERFADRIGMHRGQRALDVGCGPGALTEQLTLRLGATAVAAVDPSQSFVDAVRDRLPEVDVRIAAVDDIPFPDDGFDLVTAQLVVHFMPDPVAGLAQMARVARPGGRVAACVWDLATPRSPVAPFWQAARTLDPDAPAEDDRPGGGRGQLAAMMREAGLRDVVEDVLQVRAAFSSFDDWWEPNTFGIGPVGDYVASLDDQRREELRVHCARVMPEGPFEITAHAWCATSLA